VTLARTIWLPDDGPRTETCRSVFNVLMCKFYQFYICAVVGIMIEPLLMFSFLVLSLRMSHIVCYYGKCVSKLQLAWTTVGAASP